MRRLLPTAKAEGLRAAIPMNDNDNEERPDFGTPLLAMAQDAPPPTTVPDTPPTPGSPFDAALAAFYAAANGDDPANDRAAARMWDERQKKYGDAINGGDAP